MKMYHTEHDKRMYQDRGLFKGAEERRSGTSGERETCNDDFILVMLDVIPVNIMLRMMMMMSFNLILKFIWKSIYMKRRADPLGIDMREGC